MTVSLSCRTSYGLSSVKLPDAVLFEVVHLHVPGSTDSSSKSLLALLWGIPSRVLFEPYRGASPASLLFRTLLWGSSPSRVFTEDFNFRLSSRAVFISPQHGCFSWKIQYLEDRHPSTPSCPRMDPQRSCWHDELYQCLSIPTRDLVASWYLGPPA